MRLLAILMDASRRAWRRLRMLILRPLFGACGSDFWFDPDGHYSFKNIFVGRSVSLGLRPVILADLSEVKIGDHVMFGPEVVVVGGGHNIGVPGRFMKDVKEKTGNEDLGVVIEDDVWVGARAIILRGVCVGRGAVVAAGSVVTKSVPPYCIVGGNPARVLGTRWDLETIVKHEQALYSPDRRLPRDKLAQWTTAGTMLPPRRLAGDRPGPKR